MKTTKRERMLVKALEAIRHIAADTKIEKPLLAIDQTAFSALRDTGHLQVYLDPPKPKPTTVPQITVVRHLLLKNTKAGRMFHLLLDNAVVWPETVPLRHIGVVTGDRTRRVMTAHLLRDVGIPVQTVDGGRACKGYSLPEELRKQWRRLRTEHQGDSA